MSLLTPTGPTTAADLPLTGLHLELAGRIIGGLILCGFFFYGGGSFLLASTTGSSAGAILLLLNSAAMATVGVIAFRVLRRRYRRTAYTYLVTRMIEAGLLALAPLGTLTLWLIGTQGNPQSTAGGLPGLAQTAIQNGQSAYWLGMAALGVGSIFFCLALFRSTLLPRFLAIWGIAGYAIFALGSVLQLAGVGVGLALSTPGGLFEVAAGSFLLVKGFREVRPDVAASARPTPDKAQVGLPHNSWRLDI